MKFLLTLFFIGCSDAAAAYAAAAARKSHHAKLCKLIVAKIREWEKA